MGFFAILIALLLEQARPLGHDNIAHAALRSWARTVRRNIDAGHAAQGWIAWSLAVGVPSLIAVVIYWTLWSFSSVLGFVWLVVVSPSPVSCGMVWELLRTSSLYRSAAGPAPL